MKNLKKDTGNVRHIITSTITKSFFFFRAIPEISRFLMLRNAIIPFHRKIVEISCILDYVCWWLICVVFANQIRQNLYYFTSFDLFAIYKISILKKRTFQPNVSFAN